MITFDGIEVRFGDFVALPHFDLTIEEGEFFTFLGPSGCGKTTALRTLAGFVSPSKGRITIAGRDVTTLPSDKRDIGMVFQNYALFPTMSVYDNIAFGLKVAKVGSAELDSRVRAIASEVELTDEQLDKGVSALSGGQQQRVAIARAMVMRPKIMLLDEPLSNLDAKLRHQMRKQLKDLQGHFGITTVYVTHDQDEALAMSDRIAVINAGRIEQVGRPREVYQDSATEFVCTFIGEVNRLEPRVSARLVGQGVALDPSLPSYVRVEKLRVQRPDDATSRHEVEVAGVLREKQYHGINHTYRIQVGQTFVTAVLPEDGETVEFGEGDQVIVSLDPRHLRQYPDARGAAA